MHKRSSATVLAVAALLTMACSDSPPTSPQITPQTPSFANTVDPKAGYSPYLDGFRQALRAGRPGVELLSAELFVKAGEAGWQGKTTLIANDRTHGNGSAFVEEDPRRDGRSDVTYLVDQSDGAALGYNSSGVVVVVPNSETEPAVDASMGTWQNKAGCPAPAATKIADSGADPDLIDGLVFGDPAQIGTPFADITHAGWLPSTFFDALAPNGSAFILGVTFTFVFVDGDGVPTDIDGDRNLDVAFRETYYNLRFPWTTDASNNLSVDVQSVATHEAGHGYGLGHFGKVFLDNKGVVKFAPQAIMNAVYISAFRELTGSDNSSFCRIWAN